MKNSWTKFEILVGLLQIVLGIIMVSLAIWLISNNVQLLFKHSGSTWDDISLLTITKNYHSPILLGSLPIVSGILLLRNKLIGWITSLTTWLIYGITIIILILKDIVNETGTLNPKSDYIILGIISSLCFILTLLMSAKYFRLKYSPTNKSWLTVGLFTLIFITDKFIFN